MTGRRITLKTRAVVTAITLFLSSLIVSGFLIRSSELDQLNESLRDYGASQRQLLQAIVNGDSEGLERAQSGLSRLETLLEPFAARDRKRLLAAALPVFQELRRENNITHMYFIGLDGAVFLRVHKPAQFGDRLSRETYLRSARTDKPATGIEMGKNFFSLRSVRPISYRGKAIGYLEVAEEIDHIFGNMKSINGSDVSLFLTDAFLQSQDTAVTGEMVGEWTILYATDQDLSVRLVGKVSPNLRESLEKPQLKLVKQGGRYYAVSIAPFRDASANGIGILESHKDVTKLFADMRRDITVHVLVFAFILSLGMVAIMLIFRRSSTLLIRLKENIVKLTSDWDLGEPVQIESNDEIGDLAGAYNLMLAELKQRQLDLQKQVVFLSTLMETIPNPVFYKDSGGKYVGCNAAFASLVGLAKEQIIGSYASSIIPDGLYEEYDRKDVDLYSRGGVQFYESRIVSSDGMTHEVVFFKAPYYDGKGNLEGQVGTILDITDQQRAYQLVTESENRFRTLFNSSLDAIFVLGPDETFVEVNDTACSRLGYSRSQLLEMGPGDIDTPEQAALFPERMARLRENGYLGFESAHRQRSGGVIPVAISARIIEYDGKTMVLMFARDISQQKEAEESREILERQLYHAQKMESIGTLAGGIAHDFNNILTVIMGMASLAVMKTPADDPLHRKLEQILAAGEKGARLTRSLLTFSRKQSLNLKVLTVNEVVLGMEEFLKRVIGDDIHLRISCCDTRLAVSVDVGQLEQVLMNLAANARDAMPRGGDLTFEVFCMEMDELFISRHGFGLAGSYAVIRVSDTGDGIDEETMGKLFEPFFTTKEVGKGTGLGLSIVYGIIKQHNGFIDAVSQIDKGTSFSIFLPLVSAGPETVETRPGSYLMKGSETILVAEDDPDILAMQKLVLTDLGYTVIPAANGEEALRRFLEQPERVQLLLFDMTMPRMSGLDAYEEIRLKAPELPVIFFTGLYGEFNGAEDLTMDGAELVYKPIRPYELARKVRTVLDRQASGSG